MVIVLVIALNLYNLFNCSAVEKFLVTDIDAKRDTTYFLLWANLCWFVTNTKHSDDMKFFANVHVLGPDI